MRQNFFALILAILAIAAPGCKQTQTGQKLQTQAEQEKAHDSTVNQQSTAETEPPLLLDDEPLLLLDDETDINLPAGPMADNSRCFVCHINYMQEDIAVTHARANIGCARCHGECDAHIADESWASGGNGTAPDIMYPRPKINPFCMGCHPKGKIDTEQHKPLFAETAVKKVCTDCHGKHRLEHRKCKWK